MAETIKFNEASAEAPPLAPPLPATQNRTLHGVIMWAQEHADRIKAVVAAGSAVCFVGLVVIGNQCGTHGEDVSFADSGGRFSPQIMCAVTMLVYAALLCAWLGVPAVTQLIRAEYNEGVHRILWTTLGAVQGMVYIPFAYTLRIFDASMWMLLVFGFVSIATSKVLAEFSRDARWAIIGTAHLLVVLVATLSHQSAHDGLIIFCSVVIALLLVANEVVFYYIARSHYNTIPRPFATMVSVVTTFLVSLFVMICTIKVC